MHGQYRDIKSSVKMFLWYPVVQNTVRMVQTEAAVGYINAAVVSSRIKNSGHSADRGRRSFERHESVGKIRLWSPGSTPPPNNNTKIALSAGRGKHGALCPQKPLRLIGDGEDGGREFLYLTPTRYTDTTRMILH